MLFQMVPFILLCMVAHLTITWLVETIPTANQRALCWWFLKLPWREKRKVPSERAMKIESETGVKSDTPFCLRLPIEKTNSASLWISSSLQKSHTLNSQKAYRHLKGRKVNHIPSASSNCMDPRGHNDRKKSCLLAYWEEEEFTEEKVYNSLDK